MKNTLETFGNPNQDRKPKVPLLNLNRTQRVKVPLLIIVLVAIIGFLMVACDDGSDPGNNKSDDEKIIPVPGTTPGHGGSGGGDTRQRQLSDSRFNGKFEHANGSFWEFDGTNKAQNGYETFGIMLKNDHFWICHWDSYPYDGLLDENDERWEDKGVYSFDASGNLKIGDTIYVKASTQFGTPASVIASPIYSSGFCIEVRWTTVFGAKGYYIYKSESDTGTYTRIGTVSSADGTSYSDSGLLNNTTYYYKVSAYNGNFVESSQSESISATTFSDPPPASAPTNLRITARSGSSVTLSWDAVSGASGYIVESWTWSSSFRTTSTSTTISTSYLPDTYWVTAYNSTGSGPSGYSSNRIRVEK